MSMGNQRRQGSTPKRMVGRVEATLGCRGKFSGKEVKMPARWLFSLFFVATCLLGSLRLTSQEARRSNTGTEIRTLPLYLRASNTVLNMELAATKGQVVTQSPLHYVSWAICAAAVAWIGRLASLLRTERLKSREAAASGEILQKTLQALKDAMRKQSDHLDVAMKDGVELRKQLECSKMQHLALQEHLSIIEKDKGQLVETLEICNREVCAMKGSLTEAQGWRRECLKLDEEVNFLYQAVEERDIKVAKMQMTLGESKGWRMEQTALHNQLNELLNMLHENRDEVIGLKNELRKAEGYKLENEKLKREVDVLHKAVAQHAENASMNKKMALVWKARALESEGTLRSLQTQLANKVYKEERFKACLEACIAEGNWATKRPRDARRGDSRVETEVASHSPVPYRTSLNSADVG